MLDLRGGAQGRVETLAEAICPFCGAELTGDLLDWDLAAHCPTCRGALWCRVRKLGRVVVMDMMPQQTYRCDLTRAVAQWKLPFSGPPQVIVNLSEVEWADSTFLAALVLLKKRIDAAQGSLIFYGSRSLLGEMFAYTNLKAFFVIVASESDAMLMLKRGKPGRMSVGGTTCGAVSAQASLAD
jgi:anti-anti-sigma regulatory factor